MSISISFCSLAINLERWEGIDYSEGVAWLNAFLVIAKKHVNRYAYIFTRSSFDARDIAFRIFTDFSSISSGGVEGYFSSQDRKIYIYISAGKAFPGPPIGTLLAQYGIGVSTFCKKFNDETAYLGKDGNEVVVQAVIDWRPSKGSDLVFSLEKPSISFLISCLTEYIDDLEDERYKGIITFIDLMKVIKFKFISGYYSSTAVPFLTYKRECLMAFGSAKSMHIKVIDSPKEIAIVNI